MEAVTPVRVGQTVGGAVRVHVCARLLPSVLWTHLVSLKHEIVHQQM